MSDERPFGLLAAVVLVTAVVASWTVILLVVRAVVSLLRWVSAL